MAGHGISLCPAVLTGAAMQHQKGLKVYSGHRYLQDDDGYVYIWTPVLAASGAGAVSVGAAGSVVAGAGFEVAGSAFTGDDG